MATFLRSTRTRRSRNFMSIVADQILCNNTIKGKYPNPEYLVQIRLYNGKVDHNNHRILDFKKLPKAHLVFGWWWCSRSHRLARFPDKCQRPPGAQCPSISRAEEWCCYQFSAPSAWNGQDSDGRKVTRRGPPPLPDMGSHDFRNWVAFLQTIARRPTQQGAFESWTPPR